MKLRVTDTQIDYEGSITIGRKLLNGLLDGEKVTIHCLNGEQFETYVIAGDQELRGKVEDLLLDGDGSRRDGLKGWFKHSNGYTRSYPPEILGVTDQILDLCEEGVCVNGAAARKVQIGDIIEVSNGGKK